MSVNKKRFFCLTMFNFQFKIPFHLMVADLMTFVVQLIIQYTLVVYTWRGLAGYLKFRTDNSQSYTKGYPSSRKTEEYYLSLDWVCCERYRRCKELSKRNKGFSKVTRGDIPQLGDLGISTTGNCFASVERFVLIQRKLWEMSKRSRTELDNSLFALSMVTR